MGQHHDADRGLVQVQVFNPPAEVRPTPADITTALNEATGSEPGSLLKRWEKRMAEREVVAPTRYRVQPEGAQVLLREVLPSDTVSSGGIIKIASDHSNLQHVPATLLSRGPHCERTLVVDHVYLVAKHQCVAFEESVDGPVLLVDERYIIARLAPEQEGA